MQTFETLVVGNTAKALSSKFYSQGKTKYQGATITVENASLRFMVTGQDPTATLGHRLDAGSIAFLETFDEIEKFRAIRLGAADSTIMVTYRTKERLA